MRRAALLLLAALVACGGDDGAAPPDAIEVDADPWPGIDEFDGTDPELPTADLDPLWALVA